MGMLLALLDRITWPIPFLSNQQHMEENTSSNDQSCLFDDD